MTCSASASTNPKCVDSTYADGRYHDRGYSCARIALPHDTSRSEARRHILNDR
jgi:hypothetical protein